MSHKGDRRQKVRVDFRTNMQNPRRKGSSVWTKKLQAERPEATEDVQNVEAFRGKSALSRKRTVDASRLGHHGEELESLADGTPTSPSEWRNGVIVAIHGHFVKVDDGTVVRNCVVRRVLKSFQLDQRNVVAVGDNVSFTPLENEGVVEQVQERKGRLFRRYRKQEHLIVTNIEQAVIVAAVATPELRVHLLDRYIVAAMAGDLKPVIVFNKIDLPTDEDLDEVQRVYESLGYPVCRTSVATGEGIEQLRSLMVGKRSVVGGLSGVGKSSLINAVQPGAEQVAKPVNRASGRGQHTTTTVQLLRLEGGGYVVDTPGIRQFAFWNIDRMNVEAYFAEFQPYISKCRFANCSHTHEIDCAVKTAVECGEIADWRYDSYLKIFNDEEEFMKEWEK